MDSEYLYRAIAQFIRAQDFIPVLLTCAIARNHAFARDFAIVRDVSKLKREPMIIMHTLVKRGARINSLLARLLPEHRAPNSGIKNACAYGHLDLVKWYIHEPFSRISREQALFALKGAYRGGHRAIIDYVRKCISKEMWMMAQNTIYYSAMRGNHPALVNWGVLTRGSPVSDYSIAGAINGGHEELIACLNEFNSPNISITLISLTWTHYLKQDNQQAITEYIKVTNGRILYDREPCIKLLFHASPSMLHMVLSWATHNDASYMPCMGAFVNLCRCGDFERILMVHNIFNEHGFTMPAGEIKRALCGEHHNPEVTAYLFTQVAKYPPMDKNNWCRFLRNAVKWAGCAELQYIVRHIEILNQTISMSTWSALMRHATFDKQLIMRRL
jgi:hypothetical protein